MNYEVGFLQIATFKLIDHDAHGKNITKTVKKYILKCYIEFDNIANVHKNCGFTKVH